MAMETRTGIDFFWNQPIGELNAWIDAFEDVVK